MFPVHSNNSEENEPQPVKSEFSELCQNIYQGFPKVLNEEVFEQLLRGKHFRLERILSTGQATPEGQWCDQDWNEWVILLKGGARLRFEKETKIIELAEGDYLNIPAHCKHRVEWTDKEKETIWLALHYK